MERERKKTFKLVRNIMNIKKMFKGRHRSRKKDKSDPDQVEFHRKSPFNNPKCKIPAKLPPDADCGAFLVRDGVHLP